MSKNVKLQLNRFGMQIKKHSPEILIAVGVVGTVTSAVMACKATMKVNDILDDAKEKIDKVKTCKEDPQYAEQYSEEDAKKDLVIIYTQTAVEFAKLYGPSIILGAASLGCIITSNNVLRQRNAALGAAYTTIDKSYKEYRKRVADRFGEDVERQIKHNIKAEEIETTEVGKNGKEKKVKKCVNVVNPAEISGYARFFEEFTLDEQGNRIRNAAWQNDNEYNIMFLKAQEQYANDLLRARGHLYLNEVYDMIGIPRTKAGQVVGWVYDDENPVGDNFVDFGLYADNLGYSDYVNGIEPAILLDFNVDGNIWELM